MVMPTWVIPTGVTPTRFAHAVNGLTKLVCLAALILFNLTFYPALADNTPIKKGTFLVATKNLAGSSFSEAVILLTHYSNWGATGLAINRPAKITLEEAFPGLEQLQNNHDELYLGGPVKPDAIFVLMKTKQPHAGMRNIANDLYFAPGITAFHSGKKPSEGESARAFAGYSGWAPGQLEAEIRRGDWLVIESDLDIVFTEENQSLWKKLTRDWSGTWL